MLSGPPSSCDSRPASDSVRDRLDELAASPAPALALCVESVRGTATPRAACRRAAAAAASDATARRALRS